MSEQPEALRLADNLDYLVEIGDYAGTATDAAAELRRLHELNDDLYKQGVAFIARITALEALNAELLEALKGLVGWFDDDRMNGAEKQIKKARAAIAKGEQA